MSKVVPVKSCVCNYYVREWCSLFYAFVNVVIKLIALGYKTAPNAPMELDLTYVLAHVMLVHSVVYDLVCINGCQGRVAFNGASQGV